MIITGFENLKRAYSIDSDSSNSSDLSKIESHESLSLEYARFGLSNPVIIINNKELTNC